MASDWICSTEVAEPGFPCVKTCVTKAGAKHQPEAESDADDGCDVDEAPQHVAEPLPIVARGAREPRGAWTRRSAPGSRPARR